NGNGAPAGAELQVNTYATSYQLDPAVAAVPDGYIIARQRARDEVQTSDTAVRVSRVRSPLCPGRRNGTPHLTNPRAARAHCTGSARVRSTGARRGRDAPRTCGGGSPRATG